MSYLLELAERVEAAAGPDRELDTDIARLLGVTVMRRNEEDTENYETTNWHYTSSLDSALSLVPGGIDWAVHTVRNGYGGYAQVMPLDEADIECKAATPALALCAAALRARATLEASPRGDALDHQRTIRAARERGGQLMTEQWRWIKGFAGLYKISNYGLIFSCRVARFLSPHADADGYLRIGLWNGERQRKYAVHKLVAEAFHADKRNVLHNEVAHLDGNRSNPRADNLKWVSKIENRSHRKLHGTECSGENHGIAKLTASAVAEIRSFPKYAIDRKAMAAKYGVTTHAIDSVRLGKNWRHLSECHG